MVGLFFRKKPNYEHIAQLERENGLDDGTFSDEWVDDMQAMLDKAGIGAPPKKRELFKAPILEKRQPPRPFPVGAVSASAHSAHPLPNFHQVVRNPYTLLNEHGLLKSGLAKVILPNG